MRKLYTFVLLAFMMVAGVTLSACGGSSNSPVIYEIDTEENSLVDISTDYQVAEEGTLITVTVEPDIDVYVLNVYANETPCTKVDDSTYTFTLIADTVVRVETEIRYTEVNESEYASASTLNPTQFIKIENDSFLEGWRPYLTYNFSEAVRSSIEVKTLISSNQNVIPNEALTTRFFNSENRDNGFVDGVNVYINSEMIDYGETYIVFEFEETTSSSAPTCRLVKKIEVITEEEYDYSSNVMAETVTIDLGDVKSVWASNDYKYFEIMISDNQYHRIYGVDYAKFNFVPDATPYQTDYTTGGVRIFFSAEDVPDEVEISFSYIINHTYDIDVCGFTGDDISSENRILLDIANKTSGNAIFKDGTLTCTEEGESITLRVSDN